MNGTSAGSTDSTIPRKMIRLVQTDTINMFMMIYVKLCLDYIVKVFISCNVLGVLLLNNGSSICLVVKYACRMTTKPSYVTNSQVYK
jgi:hypothetical protein